MKLTLRVIANGSHSCFVKDACSKPYNKKIQRNLNLNFFAKNYVSCSVHYLSRKKNFETSVLGG